MAMEIAAAKEALPTTIEAVKLTFGFLCTRGDYFCELEDNLGALRNEILRLLDLVEHIQSRIRREDRRRMQKIFQVNDWFSRVDVFQFEAVQIILDAEEEIRNKCIRFMCPKNCCSCSRVGIRVSNKLDNVKELISDGSFTDVVERIPNSDNGWVSAVTDFFLHSTQRVIRIAGLQPTDLQA
ncbi:hypothetical protein JCGZ_06093 [Jatropha curcas]|uniref:Rx N-terminal domain-containing protein n=1 Tax=Jatropha curcas TaxID=180498 RepID=A0A067KLL9_JATCU|nr:hypothetical protein JCGZ_06093 [Jatropha curcas]